MDSTGTDGRTTPETRYRWAIHYRVDGDLKFISHQDTVRLFRRALIRANVPLRYTEGFNPHPRLTIPVPRPVGIASQAEVIVVETERLIDEKETLERLEAQTPADLCICGLRRLEPGEQLHPKLVQYTLEGPPEPGVDLEARIGHILRSQRVEVERLNPKDRTARAIDVRPYLAEIHLDSSSVVFTLRVTPRGTAKPAEIAGLLGYDARAINHRIRRMEVQWE